MCIGNKNTGWLRANKTGVELASRRMRRNFRRVFGPGNIWLQSQGDAWRESLRGISDTGMN